MSSLVACCGENSMWSRGHYSILGRQDYRTLRNEFTVSFKSPRASSVCGLEHGLGSRISVQLEGFFGLLTQEQSHSVHFLEKGLRHPSSVAGLAWPGLMSGQMSRTGAPLALAVNTTGYFLTRLCQRLTLVEVSFHSLSAWSLSLDAPIKPSKHMSVKIGNLVLISRLLVAAGQIALAGRRGAVGTCVLEMSW